MNFFASSFDCFESNVPTKTVHKLCLNRLVRQKIKTDYLTFIGKKKKKRELPILGQVKKKKTCFSFGFL